MRQAAGAIVAFTKDRAVADLRSDDLLRSGIYYKFVVIGEALSKLRTADPATAEGLSEYNRIIGFRNQIIHGYAMLDHETTWRVIETKIPILIGELDRLLAQ